MTPRGSLVYPFYSFCPWGLVRDPPYPYSTPMRVQIDTNELRKAADEELAHAEAALARARERHTEKLRFIEEIERNKTDGPPTANGGFPGIREAVRQAIPAGGRLSAADLVAHIQNMY